MSEPRALRVHVHEDGAVTFVDPDPSVLPIIREFNPSFEVKQESLPGFSRPRLLTTMSTPSALRRDELGQYTSEELWRSHDTAIPTSTACGSGEASLLDAKIELARRMLSSCDLCGQNCRVDRLRGERGRCGLGVDAYVYEAYLHIAEEAPVNPALNISLRGCGLRCRYCQQFDALTPRGECSDVLSASTWAQLDLSHARSLAFVGGNPTESLPSVLQFLSAAPAGLTVPIVWNSSGYDGAAALRLLRGVCDAYIPDWKYGNDTCAVALSNAPKYTSVATQAIEEMCAQKVPVFVRMLVLPGHIECCHLPSLDLLADWRQSVRLNVMAQYLPDFLIRPTDGPMARRIQPEEVAHVRRAAAHAGFELIPSPEQATA